MEAPSIVGPIRVLVIPSIVLFGIYLWSRLFEPLGWLSLIGIPFAAWVAFDSRRIQITEYHSSLAYPPLTLFLLAASSPVIVVPWYLTARDLRQARSRHFPRNLIANRRSPRRSRVRGDGNPRCAVWTSCRTGVPLFLASRCVRAQVAEPARCLTSA